MRHIWAGQLAHLDETLALLEHIPPNTPNPDLSSPPSQQANAGQTDTAHTTQSSHSSHSSSSPQTEIEEVEQDMEQIELVRQISARFHQVMDGPTEGEAEAAGLHRGSETDVEEKQIPVETTMDVSSGSGAGAVAAKTTQGGNRALLEDDLIFPGPIVYLHCKPDSSLQVQLNICRHI